MRVSEAFLAFVLLGSLTACGGGRSAEELYWEGQAALDAGDEARAIEHFEAALARNPNHEEANYRLGRIYQERDDDERALPYLERAAAADPSDAKTRFRLGEALLGVDDNERAVTELSAAIELDPERGGPYAKLAQALRRLGRDQEAREALERGSQRVAADDPYRDQILAELSGS